MIKEIEALMVHWGEQRQRHGLGSGIGSQMGMIVEWKGMAPRGTPGHRVLLAGLGMDHAAHEIEACLNRLDASGKDGARLVLLAKSRYLHELTKPEQMRCIDLPAGSDRSYRNWMHKLHIAIAQELKKRVAERTATFNHV